MYIGRVGKKNKNVKKEFLICPIIIVMIVLERKK